MAFLKTNRLKTIYFDGALEIESISLPDTPSGEFVVDDSCFVPMSEAIKQLNRINDPTNGQLAEIYDFPNGKDTGKSIPITRRHDIKDIAEISSEIMDSTKKMANEIAEGKQEAIDKADFEKTISDIKASASKKE